MAQNNAFLFSSFFSPAGARNGVIGDTAPTHHGGGGREYGVVWEGSSASWHTSDSLGQILALAFRLKS